MRSIQRFCGLNGKILHVDVNEAKKFILSITTQIKPNEDIVRETWLDNYILSILNRRVITRENELSCFKNDAMGTLEASKEACS
jgi:hypothetical protein